MSDNIDIKMEHEGMRKDEYSRILLYVPICTIK